MENRVEPMCFAHICGAPVQSGAETRNSSAQIISYGRLSWLTNQAMGSSGLQKLELQNSDCTMDITNSGLDSSRLCLEREISSLLQIASAASGGKEEEFDLQRVAQVFALTSRQCTTMKHKCSQLLLLKVIFFSISERYFSRSSMLLNL